MNNSHQPPADYFRIVLFPPQAKQILVARQTGKVALPALEAPRYARQAEVISAGLRRLLGVDAYCLSFKSGLDGQGYVVASTGESDPIVPSPFEWIDPDVLADDAFAEAQVYSTITDALAEIRHYHKQPAVGFFGRPGWLREIKDWVRQEIEPLGERLTGEHLQLNASATNSLLRLAASGSAFWFKAVGEPAVREFEITRYLKRKFPAFLPEIVAERADCKGWLSKEFLGIHPDETSPDTIWITVATALAELQVASIGQTLHLSEAGCFDAGTRALAELVDPFFAAVTDLMEAQASSSPAPLSREQLKEVRNVLFDAISTVDQLGVPATLGHLDFNTGNILVGGNRAVFLDWASGCIGSPFPTLEYLLEQIRTLRGSDQSLLARVQSAYAQKWQSLIAADEMCVALAANPLLAAFCYASGCGAWRNRSHHGDLGTAAPYLRSLTRRMKKEAEIWSSTIASPSNCRHTG